MPEFRFTMMAAICGGMWLIVAASAPVNAQNQPQSAYSLDQLHALQREDYKRHWGHYPGARPKVRHRTRLAHARWCARRYRSYDARTDRYRSGARGWRACISPYRR